MLLSLFFIVPIWTLLFFPTDIFFFLLDNNHEHWQRTEGIPCMFSSFLQVIVLVFYFCCAEHIGTKTVVHLQWLMGTFSPWLIHLINIWSCYFNLCFSFDLLLIYLLVSYFVWFTSINKNFHPTAQNNSVSELVCCKLYWHLN